MAHFRATIQGHRGEASRLGTKSSGLTASINGWDIGANVTTSYSTHLDSDTVRISFTGGSNSSTSYGSITATLKDGKFHIVDTDFPEILI